MCAEHTRVFKLLGLGGAILRLLASRGRHVAPMGVKSTLPRQISPLLRTGPLANELEAKRMRKQVEKRTSGAPEYRVVPAVVGAAVNVEGATSS